MRLVFLLLLVFLLGQTSFVSAVSVSASDFQAADIAQVKATHLNVRTGPGMRFAVIRSLPKGTRVTLLDPEQDGVEMNNETWSKVSAVVGSTKLIGWVCDRYLASADPEPDVAPVGLPAASPAITPTAPDTSDTPPPARLPAAPTDPETPDFSDLLATPLKIRPRPALPSSEEPETAPAIVATPTPRPSDSTVSVAEVGSADDGQPLVAQDDVLSTVTVPPIPMPEAVDKSLFGSAPEAVPTALPASRLQDAPALPGEAGQTDSRVASGGNGDPLNYETLRLDCRRGYFFAGVEACRADIRVSLSLPPEFVAFAGETVPVTCDIRFAYTVDDEPEERSESFSQQFEVDLVDGRGERTITQQIDFAFRLNNVSDVRLADTSCIAGK